LCIWFPSDTVPSVDPKSLLNAVNFVITGSYVPIWRWLPSDIVPSIDPKGKLNPVSFVNIGSYNSLCAWEVKLYPDNVESISLSV